MRSVYEIIHMKFAFKGDGLNVEVNEELIVVAITCLCKRKLQSWIIFKHPNTSNDSKRIRLHLKYECLP